MFSAVERHKKHQNVMVFMHFPEEASRNKNPTQDIKLCQICCNGPKYRKVKIDGLVPISVYLRLAKLTPTSGFLS